MAFIPDPAGIFKSDMHRRVLGHLSLPTETFGWMLGPLAARIAPDPHTPVETELEIAPILAELAEDGQAEQVSGAWRQTPSGHAALTGPITNEPGPDPDPALIRPALLGGPIATAGPTEIPTGATEVTA